jgi:CCR4-NOT transcription complex subunit 2
MAELEGVSGEGGEEFPALSGGIPVNKSEAHSHESNELPRRSTLNDQRYGVLSLQATQSSPDPDAQALSVGTNLTTLGLDLNASSELHRTLASPFNERQPHNGGHPDVDLQTPACFTQQSPRLSPSLLTRLEPDTLLLCFFASPGTDLQLIAADELYSRGFLWHKELCAWLARSTDSTGSEPIKTDRGEQGAFTVFDPASWSHARKDNFVLDYGSVEHRQAIQLHRQNKT